MKQTDFDRFYKSGRFKLVERTQACEHSPLVRLKAHFINKKMFSNTEKGMGSAGFRLNSCKRTNFSNFQTSSDSFNTSA